MGITGIDIPLIEKQPFYRFAHDTTGNDSLDSSHQGVSVRNRCPARGPDTLTTPFSPSPHRAMDLPRMEESSLHGFLHPPANLPGRRDAPMWGSLAAIATLTITLTLPASVVAQEAPASQKSLAEQLVDAFNGVFGVHPGMRANHPKGVLLEGTFTPTASAASVSKAAHLQKKKSPVPVTVRFSAGSGLPTVPDTNEMPRGMAVKFALPDGSKTDIVVLSFNGFPVATAEEFRDFLVAIAASGPDAPKP